MKNINDEKPTTDEKCMTRQNPRGLGKRGSYKPKGPEVCIPCTVKWDDSLIERQIANIYR